MRLTRNGELLSAYDDGSVTLAPEPKLILVSPEQGNLSIPDTDTSAVVVFKSNMEWTSSTDNMGVITQVTPASGEGTSNQEQTISVTLSIDNENPVLQETLRIDHKDEDNNKRIVVHLERVQTPYIRLNLTQEVYQLSGEHTLATETQYHVSMNTNITSGFVLEYDIDGTTVSKPDWLNAYINTNNNTHELVLGVLSDNDTGDERPQQRLAV